MKFRVTSVAKNLEWQQKLYVGETTGKKQQEFGGNDEKRHQKGLDKTICEWQQAVRG